MNKIANEIENEIKKEIESYKIHRNITRLYKYCGDRINLLLRYMISKMGLIHGLGLVDETIDNIKSMFNNKILNEI